MKIKTAEDTDFDSRQTYDFIGADRENALETIRYNGGINNKEWFKKQVLNLSGEGKYEGTASVSGDVAVSYTHLPVTKEQYYDLIWDQSNKKVRDGVREVVFDVPCTALNGNTLASYGLNSSNVQKYFKRINSKITLVYYYVAFDSTTEEGRTNAARYYQDYYSVNKETMDAYASLYTKAVKVREASSGAYIMHLSGNLVCSEEHSAAVSYTHRDVYKRQGTDR